MIDSKTQSLDPNAAETSLEREVASEPLDDDLKKYRATVDICAKYKLDANIPNGYAAHAGVLFSTFFKYADRQVCIYTGQLFEGVFDAIGDVVQRAVEFLRRNKENYLQIAIAEKVDYCRFVKKPFIVDIVSKEDLVQRLSIYDASTVPSTDHFAVMDQSAYRYETSHSQQQAIANFGNPARAEQIYNDFKSIIRNSKEIDIKDFLTPSK
jgi:hypothetical protein